MPHRIYSNENFPRQAVERLRQLGHDVRTTSDDGLANQGTPDDIVLARAVMQQRTFRTLNRKDFRRLHAADAAHAGIIVCTTDLNYEALAERIHERIDQEDNLAGQLIDIHRPQVPAAVQ